MKTKVNKVRSMFFGCVAAICCLAAILLSPINFNAEAKSLPNQEPTEYLEQTLQEFGYDCADEYNIDTLYAENLMPNGYEYTFNIDNQPCYALMVRELAEDGNIYYDIMELFIDAASPFQHAIGKKVYLDMFTYIEYANNTFIDLSSNISLTIDEVNSIAQYGFNYGGYNDYTTEMFNIAYDSKNSSSYTFPYGLPTYTASPFSNSCANIAGGIVLGYYDIAYPEIIPNFASAALHNGSLRYVQQSPEITSVIETLHYSMRTNVNDGTTVSDFKSGMQSYVNGKGRSISYTSVVTNGTFSYSNYKNQIAQSKPVALFLATFNITQRIIELNKTDSMQTVYYSTNHVMVGCGYQDIDYYRNGALFRSDKYLKISTALSGISNGYMRLNDRARIVDALGINVY